MSSRPSARPAARRPLPKAVLFDMDDTIFDHALTCRDALRAVRATYPYFRRLTLDTMWTEYSRLLEAEHPAVLAGTVGPNVVRAERFRRLASLCGQTLTDREATRLSRAYRRQYQAKRRGVSGAKRLLERLHGRTVIGIVTNNQVDEQETKLSFLGIRPLVHFMVVSEGVGVAKPDPRIFRIALDRAGAEPAQTVMVGDSWFSDVVGARSAGIRPVWFNRFHRPRPEPIPVTQVDSFREANRVESALAGNAGELRGPAR